MAGQLYLVNPSKRRKAAKKRRSGTPSAAQKRARAKFAAMARARSHAAKRPARRRRAVAVLSNPAPRRRRASAVARRSSRRVRRNPISTRGLSFNSILKTAVSEVTQAAVGGAGAIGVDMAMGQALKVLPDSMKSRITLDGGVNWGYYAAKGGIALALGIVGRMMAPPKLRPYLSQAAQGSLVVQAYEIERMMLPPEMTLGFYSPARIASARRMNGVGVYNKLPGQGNIQPQGGAVPIRGARMAGIGAGGNPGLSIG